MKWFKLELYSLVKLVGSGEEIQKPFAVMLFKKFLLSKFFFIISEFLSPQIMTEWLLEFRFSKNLSVILTNSILFERGGLYTTTVSNVCLFLQISTQSSLRVELTFRCNVAKFVTLQHDSNPFKIPIRGYKIIVSSNTIVGNFIYFTKTNYIRLYIQTINRGF